MYGLAERYLAERHAKHGKYYQNDPLHTTEPAEVVEWMKRERVSVREQLRKMAF